MRHTAWRDFLWNLWRGVAMRQYRAFAENWLFGSGFAQITDVFPSKLPASSCPRAKWATFEVTWALVGNMSLSWQLAYEIPVNLYRIAGCSDLRIPAEREQHCLAVMRSLDGREIEMRCDITFNYARSIRVTIVSLKCYLLLSVRFDAKWRTYNSVTWWNSSRHDVPPPAIILSYTF